jgi:hypothetical protein
MIKKGIEAHRTRESRHEVKKATRNPATKVAMY